MWTFISVCIAKSEGGCMDKSRTTLTTCPHIFRWISWCESTINKIWCMLRYIMYSSYNTPDTATTIVQVQTIAMDYYVDGILEQNV